MLKGAWVRKMVIEKGGFNWRRRFPSSTMETRWPIPGDGYRIIVSFISPLLQLQLKIWRQGRVKFQVFFTERFSLYLPQLQYVVLSYRVPWVRERERERVCVVSALLQLGEASVSHSVSLLQLHKVILVAKRLCLFVGGGELTREILFISC